MICQRGAACGLICGCTHSRISSGTTANFSASTGAFGKSLAGAATRVFFSRFFVQWYATEKRKQVVVPQAFWWLSLIGSVTLLCYGLFYQKDSVVIFAYAFTWIPYIRNLVIHRRNKAAHVRLRRLRAKKSAAGELLSELRREAGGVKFTSSGAAGAAAVAGMPGRGSMPYFFSTCCAKSGCFSP